MNCFTIFKKNDEIVAIIFDLAEAEVFAKDANNYDEIFWCAPRASEYRNGYFIDKQ